METCPNCGHENRATARFCTSCGFRTPEKTAAATDASSNSYANTWLAESAQPAVEVAEVIETDIVTNTWPPAAGTVEEQVIETYVWAAPVAVAEALAEPVVATAGFNEIEDTIAEVSQNKINIALYHVESIRQMIPALSQWSEDRASAVSSAIAAMEAAIKGREGDDDTYYGLRATVAAAKKDPRDIDVMIALSDRSIDIEDLLSAHDKYSIGIRNALIDLKPVAVDYVRVPKRRPATRRASSSNRTTRAKTASKPRSTTKSSTSNKSRTTASNTP